MKNYMVKFVGVKQKKDKNLCLKRITSDLQNELISLNKVHKTILLHGLYTSTKCNKVKVLYMDSSAFNTLQVEEIKRGLKEGLEVNYYAHPKYNWKQMAQIRMGLEKGLNVSIFTDSNLSSYEMYEIRTRLEDKVKEA